MPIAVDIADGLNDALKKADDINTKFLDDLANAWAGWKAGDSFPSVDCEEYDYDRHLAETVVNSYYNSVSNGVMVVYHPVSGTPTTCTWVGSTEASVHVEAIVQGMNAGKEFLDLLTDEMHKMVVGSGSLNGITGSLSGSDSVLRSGLEVALNLTLSLPVPEEEPTPEISHARLGQAFGTALTAYCASLAGNVSGLGSGVCLVVV
jgi:hypothetical protein